MDAKLILADGSVYIGKAFGSLKSVAGEVVFNTGMVGYPECLTDPSYKGQILVLTYPLIGNYGVPSDRTEEASLSEYFESNKIHIAGLIVSQHSVDFSHWSGFTNLDTWLKQHEIPGLWSLDTRYLTQKLREHGVMLGKIIVQDQQLDFFDPNQQNLVAKVSRVKPQDFGKGKKRVLLVDCGCKYNIVRSLVKRNLAVRVVPWNWDLGQEDFDGVVISNGPGDPKMCAATIQQVKKLLREGRPILGICLGHQVLALAAGADTYKLKYGHRGQNQPCIMVGSKRCYITSQNHGYAVDENSLSDDWEPWFFNANDGTNEGIRHRSRPFMSVQFHPEANPGPVDTQFIFDEFVSMLKT